MDKIGAISTGNAYNYKLTFKGVNQNPQSAATGSRDTFAARQQLLETLGRAEVNANKPVKTHKGHSFNLVTKNGRTYVKDTGAIFNGTIVKNENTKEGKRKIILEYQDGRLDKLTKYKAGSNDIDFFSEYSYSGDGKTKTYKTYRYNDLVGDFALWDKTTITPEIIANHHIGRIETSQTTLTIEDRRTHKKISQTTLEPSRLDPQNKLAPKYENDMQYLTRRLMPVERLEFDADGKTVNKKVIFQQSLQRAEKIYENGSKRASGTIFYDRFNRPFKMLFEGTLEKPLLPDKNRPNKETSPIPYKAEVIFVTNRSIDLHNNNYNYEIVSSGKIASITVRSAGTEMRLQNWFKDKSTRKTIEVETGPTNSRLIIDPKKTAFATFFDTALDSETEASCPGLDLSEFQKDYEKRVDRVPAFVVSHQGHMGAYYPNAANGNLLFHEIQISDNIDPSLRPKINEVYLQLDALCRKYNEGD